MEWLMTLGPGWHLEDTLWVVRDPGEARTLLGREADFLQWDGETLICPQPPPSAAPVEMPLSRRQGTGNVGPYVLVDTPLFIDGRAHARFRDLLVKAWEMPASVQLLRPWASALADRLVAAKAGSGPFDFMTEIALPLSCYTLAAFFGCPPEQWLDLARRHPAIWGEEGDPDDGTRLLAEFQVQVWRTVTGRRAQVGHDAISRMVQVCDATGCGLEDAEIQTLVLETTFVSTEATTLLIGSVAAATSDGPWPWAAAAGVPASCLVTEVLAHQQPVQGVFRRTETDAAWKGTVLPAGTGVFVSLRAANEALTSAADDDRRVLRRHLAFGAGRHRCPGGSLAVMLAEVVAEAIRAHGPVHLADRGCASGWGGLLYGPRELWLEMGR